MGKFYIFWTERSTSRQKLDTISENKVNKELRLQIHYFSMWCVQEYWTDISYRNITLKIRICQVSSPQKTKLPFGVLYLAMNLSSFWFLQVKTSQPNWHYHILSH